MYKTLQAIVHTCRCPCENILSKEFHSDESHACQFVIGVKKLLTFLREMQLMICMLFGSNLCKIKRLKV